MVLQPLHISSSDCVMLEGTSGAHGLPVLVSSGHGWFVGAALGLTTGGFSAVPGTGKVVRLQVALDWAV